MPRQRNTSIPLLCNLCPKNPTFSDVSHLLTHISSKSHLSNRFKLQIRSQTESEARKVLADFDSWYADNGLEDLLSDRLAAKEQKRTGRAPRIPPIAASAPRKPGTRASNALQQPFMPTEPYRPPVPRMHTWSTESFAAAIAFPLPSPAPLPAQHSPWRQDIYQTPTMQRNIPNFSRDQSPLVSSPLHSPESSRPTPKLEDTEDDEIENDGSKLKGVYWPGMHLFDSATAEMKRMRNQKKDGTALEKMKLRSTEIEPTEWIFNPDGGFRRARDIFDESTEDSPEQNAAAPSPRKRRSRKVLAEASINVPRRPRSPRNTAKKPIYKRRKTIPDPQEQVSTKILEPSNPKVLSSRFTPTDEEHEEFRLALEDFGKYRPLNVFRDAEVDSPGRTESPLEDHRFDFSNGRPLGSRNKTIMAPQNSPTPMCKPVPIRFNGKENLDSSRMNGRSMSTLPSAWNPGLFHNDFSNPLHAHPHAQTFSYGARENGEVDFKSGTSDFAGDFRPMTAPNAFTNMRAHGFYSRSELGMGSVMHFGR